jgi:hypothetical protein
LAVNRSESFLSLHKESVREDLLASQQHASFTRYLNNLLLGQVIDSVGRVCNRDGQRESARNAIDSMITLINCA